MLDETPFFFDSGGHNLFGVLHRPSPGAATREAFVFCHPFGEEKLWTHRVFVLYARRLAAAGYAVLRFDLMGNGDSGGVFTDSTFESACADLHSAVHELRQRTETREVSLLGLRLGATVAARVADESADVRHLILWSPITKGGAYMQDLLRINVTTQMAAFKEIRQDRLELVAAMQQGSTVNVDGYEIGFAQYSSFSAVNLEREARRFSGACLIVQIDRQPKPAPDHERLAAQYSSVTLKFAAEDPFWKEIPRSYQRDASALFSLTTEWLEAQCT